MTRCPRCGNQTVVYLSEQEISSCTTTGCDIDFWYSREDAQAIFTDSVTHEVWTATQVAQGKAATLEYPEWAIQRADWRP